MVKSEKIASVTEDYSLRPDAQYNSRIGTNIV